MIEPNKKRDRKEYYRIYGKAWRAAHPKDKEKHRLYQKAWREANPEKYKETQERSLRKRGIISKRDIRWWKKRLREKWPRPIADASRYLGWTAKDIATLMSLNPVYINQILLGYRVPSKELQEKFQKIFGDAGEYIDIEECWPTHFEFPDVDFANTPDPCFLSDEDVSTIHSTLAMLPKYMQEVLVFRFFENLPMREIGEKSGISHQRISQIEAEALRKLRHPKYINRLREVAENVFGNP